MPTDIRSQILKWYLRAIALVQFVLWGLSHLFFPEWYLTVIAGKEASLLTPQILLMCNEIGASVVGISVATFLVANKPVKNFPVILINYIIGLGSMFATLYHILIRKASNEWGHVVTVLIMLAGLSFLYPWKKLKEA